MRSFLNRARRQSGRNKPESASEQPQPYIETSSAPPPEPAPPAIAPEKVAAYDKAHTRALQLLTVVPEVPPRVLLDSRLCTQEDLESDWCRFWLHEMQCEPIYHRKLWELAYIAATVYSHGKIGGFGLGFGCGEEALPSVFAKYGATILATDLAPGEAATQGWSESGQYTRSLEQLRKRNICPDESALKRIGHRFVNMKEIPADLGGHFDYCWSSCALEHIGTIADGLEFIEKSLTTLRPGGIAVHTTEFNLDAGETLDEPPTVLFQRHHFEELSRHLADRGHTVAPLNFDEGTGEINKFVDFPPYAVMQYAHLRLRVIEQFRCTSFGIIVTKGG